MSNASFLARLAARVAVALVEYLVDRHDAHVVTIHGRRIVIRDRTGAVLAEPKATHADPGTPFSPL